MKKEIVVVRGGGDLASGTIHRLHRCGFQVLVMELPNPTAIRRKVAFSEAIYEGMIEIEGVTAVYAKSMDEIINAWEKNHVPIVIDPQEEYRKLLKAKILVDATISKKNNTMSRDMAEITIALGPGFLAGKDVDVVIETNRGHDLGRLIFKGEAQKNTGIPGTIGGYSIERVVRSPQDGIIQNEKEISDIVSQDEVLAYVGEAAVTAPISGLLRGIIRTGSKVKKDLKIADIDPRVGERDNCFTISDKARNIAGGVLEAILLLQGMQQKGFKK